MKVFYVFIDGIGAGSSNPEINPFARFAKSAFLPLAGEDSRIKGLHFKTIDASLGVKGLPQSATGQTALWTGMNGPQIQGHHLTGFPGPTLARVIHEHSIVKVFLDHGKQATLINAYSKNYLEKLALNPRLTSASTHVQIASGQTPLTMDDLKKGQAIFMDITHEALHQISPGSKELFPVIDSFTRGRDYVEMSRQYDLTIFEYFLTDKAGHDSDWKMASWAIRNIEGFLRGIIDTLNREDELLILSSDHGNLEDMSTESHTKNPVPLLAYGSRAEEFVKSVASIKDIVPAIYEFSSMDVKLPDPL